MTLLLFGDIWNFRFLTNRSLYYKLFLCDYAYQRCGHLEYGHINSNFFSNMKYGRTTWIETNTDTYFFETLFWNKIMESFLLCIQAMQNDVID
jgi:hypothetical protein